MAHEKGVTPTSPSFAVEKGRARTKVRVAIVDDEESLCSVISTLVKRLGYEVSLVAHDGAEIVTAIQNKPVDLDLVIMDYRMLNMDGMEAAKLVLKERPLMRVIIVSADDTVEQEALSAGLFFVKKPFSITEFSRKINEALGAKIGLNEAASSLRINC